MAGNENSGRAKASFDLSEETMKEIYELYKEGGSDVEAKAIIYIARGSFSNDLWDRWIKEEPIFSETIKMGKMLSQAWWQKEGRTQLTNREFSFTGWYMNMKNRFGWCDKNEIQHSGGVKITKDLVNVSTDDLRDLINESEDQ